MKDIDFDELDQAVGSVLNKTQDATDTPADATPDAAAVSTTPHDSDNDDAPATDDPLTSSDTSSPSDDTSEPTTSPLVAPARRRGQFLDMVHPSADMTQRNSALPRAPRKMLSPLPTSSPENQLTETTEAVEETPEAPVTSSSIDSSDTPLDAPQSSGPAWPDPVDLSSSPETPKDSPEVGAPTVPDEPATDDASASTPFVSDAQVEKRPLGAFAASEESAPDDAESVETGVDTPEVGEDGSESPEAAPPSEPLSPELDASIVSVESQEEPEDGGMQSEDSPAPIDTPAEEPAAEPTIVTEKVEAHEIAPAMAAAQSVVSPIGQSISQQYTTPAAQASSEDEHPLFGEEFHQPLQTTAKKKGAPKALIIAGAIVILLAIGAAAGYFLYMSGL